MSKTAYRCVMCLFKVGIIACLIALAMMARAKADAGFWDTPAVRACCSEADATDRGFRENQTADPLQP